MIQLKKLQTLNLVSGGITGCTVAPMQMCTSLVSGFNVTATGASGSFNASGMIAPTFYKAYVTTSVSFYGNASYCNNGTDFESTTTYYASGSGKYYIAVGTGNSTTPTLVEHNCTAS